MYLASHITSYISIVGIVLIFLFVVGQITAERGGGGDDKP